MKKNTNIYPIAFLKIHLIVPMIFVGLLLLSSITGYSQIGNDYKEKVYLHFDKPQYTSGENIWFKAYLVDAKNNKPIALSKVLYVELIDPFNKIMISKTIKIEAHGTAGDFQLPSELTSGKYMVRAYTSYMRNFDNAYFFRKDIQINNLGGEKLDAISKKSKRVKKERKKIESTDLKPDVQFFPEGGNMVNNISNRIGFKAIGTNGKGISISGTIIDDNGVEKVKISTYNLGMGMFGLNPEAGKTYQAIIDYEGKSFTYTLPKALDKGVAMLIINSKDNFRVHLQSSLPDGIKDFILVGRQRGKIVLHSLLEGNNPQRIINISTDILIQGIIQFTLYDKNDKPICERLAFVESAEIEPIVNISPSQKTFGKRDQITINISLKDQLKKAIQADISLAVTDLDVVGSDIYGITIKSQLLLNSELKGVIEHPNYYFESDDSNRKGSLDLLMICQGWRRYIWNDTVDDSIQQYPYAIENGFSFAGSIRRFYSSKIISNVDVSLSFLNKDSFEYFEMKSDEEGKFLFGDFDILDTTKVVIQAKNYWKIKNKGQKKKSMMDYLIELDSIEVPKITRELFQTKTANDSLFDSYISRSKQTYYNDSLFAVANGTIQLTEVNLISVKSKIERIKDEKRKMYGQPSYSVDYNDLPYIPYTNPLEALQGRIPGLIVNSDGTARFTGTGSFSLSNNALILLDGMPLDSVDFINADDIDFIDVLKGPETSIYGARGAGGVIVIHSKDGVSQSLRSKIYTSPKTRLGILSFMHPGYYQAREFYAPKYITEKPDHVKLDYRSTLYWNPTVKIDNQGKAKISFYSADISTTYRVELEGLTTDGIPIVEEIFIDVDE